jgi:hypothetical protein
MRPFVAVAHHLLVCDQELLRGCAQVLKPRSTGVGDAPVRGCGTGDPRELGDCRHIDKTAVLEYIERHPNGRFRDSEVRGDLLSRERPFRK